MVTKHVVKACCGNKSYIFEMKKPIMKSHIQAFEAAGYLIPGNFISIGLFYAQKLGLIANGSFGSTSLQVRASGKNSDDLLNAFESILNSVVDI